MGSRFSVKLGFFAKRCVVDIVPGMPDGAFYGYISTGVAMPSHGACYVAQFDSSATGRARIIAYVDLFGRAYACDAPLSEEPKVEATMVLYSSDDQSEDAVSGLSETAGIDVFSESGERRHAAEVTVSGIENVRSALFEYKTVDSSFEGDFRVKTQADYFEFMATAYLAFVEFGHFREPLGGNPSGTFDLEAIYQRFSNFDLFDAVNHEVLEAENSWSENPANARGIERYLVHMLHESGIVGLSADDLCLPGAISGPNARLIRTARYADMFYVDFYFNTASECIEDGAFTTSEKTREARRKLLRAESALNRFRLIAWYLEGVGEGNFDDSEASISEYDASYAELICMQAPDPSDPADVSGRWDTHLAISRSGELWRLPYRVSYEFCLNEGCDAVAFSLAVPDKGVMAQTTWDADANRYVAIDERKGNDLETRYAGHAALLAAACAFHASPQVSTVCVNCLRGGSKDDVVISVRFDRERFCIAYASEDGHSFSSPRDTLGVFDARFEISDLGRLQAVDPLFNMGEGEFETSFEPTIARDRAHLDDAAQELLGVDCAMDMNIFEDAQRRVFADEVIDALDNGADSALEKLKCIHDRSEDLLVRGICSRLAEDFSEHGCSDASFIEVKEAFIDAYGLRALALRASALVRDNDPSAIGVLEELAALGDSLEGFSDSSRACYRYFDGYESRAMYSRYCAADASGRKVLPLPDEVFLAHDSLAQELTSTIAGADEALIHAKRCIEFAPSRAYSYLRAARVYFVKNDFESEAEMCCEALRVSWNANDTSLALYWLAYSFWKREKYDAAVACYRRVASMGSYMSEEANAELSELIASVKGLKKRTPKEENDILVAEGVPIDALEGNAEFMLEAAKACVDSSAVSLGCTLAGSAARVLRDDAVIPALRALRSGMK